MTDANAVLAEVHTYDELQAALRARALALDVVIDSRCSPRIHRKEALDGVAGLPAGYSSKVLAGRKRAGRTSLGALLSALGLKLLVVEDPEALARFTTQIARGPHANGHTVKPRTAAQST